MKTFLRAFIVSICLSPIGCDGMKSLATTIPNMLGVDACEMYIEKGRGIIESAWVHDWKVFEPIFERDAPEPLLDEAYCREVIEERGAMIELNPGGSHASMALVYRVFLDSDYYSWTDVRRARTMCHEAQHIAWQHRVGLVRAAADYVSPSGRIATEAVPYALGDLMMRWYGADEVYVAASRTRRAKRFPRKYKLARVTTPECVLDYFTAVSHELRDRVVSLPGVNPELVRVLGVAPG